MLAFIKHTISVIMLRYCMGDRIDEEKTEREKLGIDSLR